MFGYVLPAFPALSDEDKHLWQSFYCSLCRKIGEKSQAARLGLSYDLTFLAILTASLSDEEPTASAVKRCIMHPSRKTDFYNISALDYAASASIILIKEKLSDDAKDKKNPLCSFAKKCIADANGEAALKAAVADSLSRLDAIERANTLDIDLAADSFACLCGKLFELSPTPSSSKKILYWLGYNLGRWIYLADAWEDLEDDIKKGNYNPFKDGRSFEEIKASNGERIKEMLTFTLSEAASAFDLLAVKRYSSLLENIIYVGLFAKLTEIMKGNTAV